jgi:pSer/pThr/pTyr-binding forkhead associated (FHA) protein
LALTIAIKADAEGEPLALTFDAPRIAIGRSKACDLWLPDATVSKRHASIRRDGGRTVILDEGSTNGIIVARAKLPPQAPRALGDGDVVRIGRVWLEVRQAGGVASSAGDVRRVALELVRRQLGADGEAASTVVEVLATGQRLELGDSAREYVIGRGADCDLALDEELASRQHAAVAWRDGWTVRDLGSKRGTILVKKDEGVDGEVAETQVSEAGRLWKDGELMRIGETVLRLCDPIGERLEELVSAADVRMRPDEFHEAPPGDDTPPPPPIAESVKTEDAHADAGAPDEEDGTDPAPIDRTSTRPSAGLAALDTAVVLVALGLLALSLAGLFWLLR